MQRTVATLEQFDALLLQIPLVLRLELAHLVLHLHVGRINMLSSV